MRHGRTLGIPAPVEMKLRRGVDIPSVPLLNRNLIARPRRSITPYMYHATMQIIRRTRVTWSGTHSTYLLIRTDFSQFVLYTFLKC